LRPAVTAFVAEAAVGILVLEVTTASWIVSIGVLTALSIEALVSDPPIMNMIAEMIKTNDTPKTIQGVYAAKLYCHVLKVYSEAKRL
jgi:hypothetical protein